MFYDISKEKFQTITRWSYFPYEIVTIQINHPSFIMKILRRWHILRRQRRLPSEVRPNKTPVTAGSRARPAGWNGRFFRFSLCLTARNIVAIGELGIHHIMVHNLSQEFDSI